MADAPDTSREATPYEKFLALARKVGRTPKAEVEKRDRAWRERKTARQQSSDSRS